MDALLGSGIQAAAHLMQPLGFGEPTKMPSEAFYVSMRPMRRGKLAEASHLQLESSKLPNNARFCYL